MRMSEFRRAGHTPSLVAALLHFDISFAIWVILGALGAYIAEDLGLNAAQKGVLVAIPLLSRRRLPRHVRRARRPLRPAPDRHDLDVHRPAPAPVGLARRDVDERAARRRRPARRRGRVVRHQPAARFAAGTRRSTRASPWASPAPATPARSPARCSPRAWPSTSAGTASWASRSSPRALVLIAFRFLAKEPPAPASASRSAPSREMLGEGDTWKLCALYAVTFGGFVGLSSLPADLLPRRVRPVEGRRRVAGRDRRRRGQLRAPVRRPPRRPLRRHARADRRLRPRRAAAARCSRGIPSLTWAAIGFPVVMALPRPRQRRDVPARRPALPRADRRRHRPRRRGRRPRRLHAADRARLAARQLRRLRRRA